MFFVVYKDRVDIVGSEEEWKKERLSLRSYVAQGYLPICEITSDGKLMEPVATFTISDDSIPPIFVGDDEDSRGMRENLLEFLFMFVHHLHHQGVLKPR